MTFTEIKDVLEALSYVATAIGVPVAIAVFLYEKHKDRLAAETATYLQANEKYIQYLTLCLEYPKLGCFDISLEEPDVKDSGLDVKTLTLFTILISTLETGFLLYRNHRSALREKQWRGWLEYMVYWASRTDFRKAWIAIGPQFDRDYQKLTEQLIMDSTVAIGPQE